MTVLEINSLTNCRHPWAEHISKMKNIQTLVLHSFKQADLRNSEPNPLLLTPEGEPGSQRGCFMKRDMRSGFRFISWSQWCSWSRGLGKDAQGRTCQRRRGRATHFREFFKQPNKCYFRDFFFPSIDPSDFEVLYFWVWVQEVALRSGRAKPPLSGTAWESPHGMRVRLGQSGKG